MKAHETPKLITTKRKYFLVIFRKQNFNPTKIMKL